MQASDFADSIREFPGLVIHHDVSFERKVPTVAITFAKVSATDVASSLRENGLIASGGFQCAPQAHRALGTAESGVIRFSFRPTNEESDVSQATEMLKRAVASYSATSR